MELREEGKRDPYVFQRAILGDKDLDPEFHYELCQFLYHPHRRKLLCGFRGSLKTSAIRSWLLYQGLYCMETSPDERLVEVEGFFPNFSSFLIEQKFENAEAHHAMLQAKFRYGPQSAILQDMFFDRLDGAFDRWTTKRTYLKQSDANAEPFVTIGSLDAKLEGGHKDAIACDDLEGADAETSDIPNEESARFVQDRAPHLLKERYGGYIIIGGTPHGGSPLVWRLRNMESRGTLDNSRRKIWHLWWKSCWTDDGRSQWEERFPTGDLRAEEAISRQAGGHAWRGWCTQMLLQEHIEGIGQFNMERIRENLFHFQYLRWHNEVKLLIKYSKQEFNYSALNAAGEPEIFVKQAQVDVTACRPFIHSDPAHKSKEERIDTSRKPSKWAIVVCLVAPDWHVFVVDCFLKEDSSVDVFLEQWLRFFRYWGPHTVGSCTYDPVGAQSWVTSHMKMLEKYKYPQMKTVPKTWNKNTRRLPRPSTLMAPAHKHSAGKIEHVLHQLQLPHHMGWLHLRADSKTGEIHQSQADLYREHELLGVTDDETFDGIDALSQGPDVWSPPSSKEAVEERIKRQRMIDIIERHENAIYNKPWPDQRDKEILGLTIG